MGQMRLTREAVDLGLEDHSVATAADRGAKSLVIGTALVGGAIPEEWFPILEEALHVGLDIVAGVHTRLAEQPRLVAAAKKSGARLVDVRVPPKDLPVGSGQKRTGLRLLTVGTDCAVGMKYTALALDREMRARGLPSDFRASGQTGIMIAGCGLPIDSVVSDFVSGASELLSPDNDAAHWDMIEGQGGLYHPGYAAVSVGLLLGSQPDAFVVCTEAGRTHIGGWPDFEVPTIQAVIDRTISIGRQVNPAIRCVGISANTSMLSGGERSAYLKDLSDQYGLPAVDPVAGSVASIIDYMAEQF